MYWITPEGEYVVGDRPSLRHVACAARPGQFYVFTGTISLDPGICWRVINQTEIDALKDATATSLINGPPTYADVLKAFALVVMDEINILRTNPTTVFAARTASQLKTAIINKLGNP